MSSRLDYYGRAPGGNSFLYCSLNSWPSLTRRDALHVYGYWEDDARVGNYALAALEKVARRNRIKREKTRNGVGRNILTYFILRSVDFVRPA